jgi:hypothetical protein
MVGREKERDMIGRGIEGKREEKIKIKRQIK